MEIEIVTKDDLQIFRRELLEDLRKMLLPSQIAKKEWLKSSEVRKLMKISPGTLQNLRINRKLEPSKIGGILYYRYDDIEKLLEGK
jgi:hypothetical protein